VGETPAKVLREKAYILGTSLGGNKKRAGERGREQGRAREGEQDPEGKRDERDDE